MVKLDVLALTDASVAAVGVTLEVLDAANRLARRKVFDARVVSTAASARLRNGVRVVAQPIGRADPRDVVVVPGLGCTTPGEVARRMADRDVQRAAKWLQQAHAGGGIVAASCSAVFVLAKAGLLEGRRCTSTWWLVPVLATTSPGSDATLDTMVVEDDRVWTAGASFAHIDLMLALVARCTGPALAADVARHLVVEQRVSQARFVAPSFLAAQDALAGRVEALVRRRLGEPVTLQQLADEVGTSVRTLSRRIEAATGLSPMQFVQKIRLDTALHRLQTTREPIEAIAQQVGFADGSALYRLLLRHTGKPPGAFRERRIAA